MYSFICKVITPQGQITKVKMKEKDKIECLKKLKRNGMTPVSIEKVFSFNKNYDRNFRKQKKITATIHLRKKKKLNLNLDSRIQFLKKVSLTELKEFTEEFYLLKTLNFTNARAIQTLIEKTENLYFKQILNKILKELKTGKYIYKTMKTYTNVFPSVYINFIKNGELTGDLKEYLKYAITYLEDEEKIKNKIRENLIPSIIIFVGILILTILSVFIVIPGIQELISVNGNMMQLPKITVFVAQIVKTVIKYWYIVICCIAILLAIFIRYINTDKGKYKIDYFKYSNFLFGRLEYLIDFSRVINSVLINRKGKVRIQDALEISKTVTDNSYMISKIEEAISNIYLGKTWISVFEKEGRLNPIIIEILKKGYANKSLNMLEKVLEYVNIEIQKETDKLLKRLPEISYFAITILLLIFFIVFLIPFIQIYLGGILVL